MHGSGSITHVIVTGGLQQPVTVCRVKILTVEDMGL